MTRLPRPMVAVQRALRRSWIVPVQPPERQKYGNQPTYRLKAEGFVAAHTLPTIFDIVAQSRDGATARVAVGDVLRIVDVAAAGKVEFQQALAMSISDSEGAVQAAAAIKIGADYLVTRNEKDSQSASVPTADPATVLALLKASSPPECDPRAKATGVQ